MIRHTMLIALVLISQAPPNLHNVSADPPDSLTLSKSTVAVLEIDLTKIDCVELERWVKQSHFDGATDQEINAAFTDVKKQIDALRQSGTDRLFVSWRTSDILSGMPVVQAATENSETLRKVLSKVWESLFGVIASDMKVNSVWATFGRDIERIASGTIQTTERFASPLANRQLDHQFVISLPPESRDDLIALWPQTLPAGWLPIAISPQQLVQDIEMIDVQWSLPPQAALKIALQATSDEAVQRLIEQVNALTEARGPWKSALRVAADDRAVMIESQPPPAASIALIILDEVSGQVDHSRQETRTQTMINRMKQIGIGLHNYHSAYKHFPLPATTNASGDELLSWRVSTAPFTGEQRIYEEIDKHQTWDSEANQEFTHTIVAGFQSSVAEAGMTAIRLPAIKGSMWDGTHEKPHFREITDGTSNTIAVAIAPIDQAVPWTQPEVWQLDENDLIGSFFGDRDEVIVLAFDGAVHTLKKADMTNERLRGLLTIAGREVFDW
ncbi:DUF1559 family PulG-like putative transporter [Allorhodopirellula heiligendammensis]|uniref:DUF1559 domain-containing protein n=1 Tax=Allorhodopirellula heiligendammensis TaxID=2714739 RepID=A0A5C6C6D9_9BACT|nr:DUF1559 domain-containing protein [Allorhodopirellula heiligendammensis]TWU18349.1 hypothetical protein Poly21_05110 [Allorhodopirellula heiligendammensis]